MEAYYAEILIRTITATVLGGIIGLERQSKHRPAGFRTHILVCLSACTIMILAELIFKQYHEQYGILSDPMRMGAQVISGIGFLGAGTIIHSGISVRGLTTAASLWAVAAVGLVVGSGFYFLAVTVTVIIYITLLIFNKISRKFERQDNVAELVVELVNKPKVIGAVNLALAKFNCKILDMEISNTADSDTDAYAETEALIMKIVIKLRDYVEPEDIVNIISKLNGVIAVEKI